MKTTQLAPEEEILKRIPEDKIALIGTINDAANLSPLTIEKRFTDWMDTIATTVFLHKDNQSISYFYVIEECKTSDKKHLHFILFKHGIGRETETPEQRSLLASKLEKSYPFRSNLQINPYLPGSEIDGKDWISYITKDGCEFSGFSPNLKRKIRQLMRQTDINSQTIAAEIETNAT